MDPGRWPESFGWTRQCLTCADCLSSFPCFPFFLSISFSFFFRQRHGQLAHAIPSGTLQGHQYSRRWTRMATSGGAWQSQDHRGSQDTQMHWGKRGHRSGSRPIQEVNDSATSSVFKSCCSSVPLINWHYDEKSNYKIENNQTDFFWFINYILHTFLLKLEVCAYKKNTIYASNLS